MNEAGLLHMQKMLSQGKPSNPQEVARKIERLMWLQRYQAMGILKEQELPELQSLKATLPQLLQP